MRKLFHNMLNALKLTDEDDEFDDEYDESPLKEEFKERPIDNTVQNQAPQFRRYDNTVKKTETDDITERRSNPQPQLRKDLKPSYAERTRFQYGNEKTKVELRAELASSNGFVLRPTSFEDSKIVCDVLKQKGFVMLNFEGVRLDISQRLMDFACGVVYALDGKLYRLSEYTFIISPRDMDIEGDILKKIAGDGMNLIVPTLSTPDDM